MNEIFLKKSQQSESSAVSHAEKNSSLHNLAILYYFDRGCDTHTEKEQQQNNALCFFL